MEIQRKAKEEIQSYQRIQGEKDSLVRNGASKNSKDKRKKKIESEEVNEDNEENNETQYGEQILFQDTEKPIKEIAQDQIFNQQKSKISIKEKISQQKRELFQQRQSPDLKEEDQSQIQDYHDEQDSQSEEQEKSYQEDKVSNKILNIQISNKGSQEYVIQQIQKERNNPSVNSNRLTTVQQKNIQFALPQQSKKYTRQSTTRHPKNQQISSPLSSKSKKKS